MSSLRHLWFDSRHLSGLAELEALPFEARETILSTGDRLAEVSMALAQAFCRQAPIAWLVFGAENFGRWAAIGEDLAGHEPASRDGALAYFAIPPDSVRRRGLERAEEWVAVGRDVLRVSRRLGTQFFQASAPLFDRLPVPFGLRLRAWAEQGRLLLGCNGWKGEFLAVSYFSSAAAALPVLSPEEIAAWAKLGVLVQGSGSKMFYTRLPDGFMALSQPQRLAFLLTVQQAADRSAPAATEIFFGLPPTLASLSPALRSFYLFALAPVICSDPHTVPGLLPLLGPVAKTIDLAGQPALQRSLLGLANTFPAAIPRLIRTLPRVCEETSDAGLQEWLATGARIAADNPEAGVAYFALESRTSFQVLRQASAGIDLEEVQELLRKYVQMLTGTPVGIRRQEFFSYPPALEEAPSEELTLPGRVEMFETWDENFRLFRTLAAQQAGRREFGTYQFSLSRLWSDLPAAVRRIMRDDATPEGRNVSSDRTEGETFRPLGGLAEYFRCFVHPDIVEALFVLTETQRIQARLAAAYRGLSADVAWLSALSLPSLLPETLVSLKSLWSDLPAAADLQQSVYDSALTAATLYLRLLSSLATARPNPDEAADFGPLVFDKLSGDALIDPDMDNDDSPPPAQAPPEITELQLEDEMEEDTGGSPLSAEELKALIEAGLELQIRQGKQDRLTPQGLYASDLNGKLPGQSEMEHTAVGNDAARAGGQRRVEHQEDLSFYYDEWDYQIADYRTRWCRLREIVLAGDAGEFFSRTLSDYTALTPAIKHEFQRIRPEQYRLVRGLEDGHEFDLNAAVTAAVDRRAGCPPSAKLYTERRQTERDVAALFLLDMSASTDEPLVPPARDYSDEEADDWPRHDPPPAQPKPRRIIDVTKETLVLMAEALEEIGDSYAIYGFSGQGRDNIEFYHVKSFVEALSPTVKGRIGAIEPKRSTRMGPAVRHALEKLKNMACRVKLLILLSDGFPQDMDYGPDRRSTTYGIRDTMVALREAEKAGVLTFCLTVDKAGHDYLREMCEPSRYLVLDDVASLPTELPKVYQRVGLRKQPG